MTIKQKELVEKFNKYPSYIGKGAGYLANKFKCEKSDIEFVRSFIRKGEDLVNNDESAKVESIKGNDKGEELYTLKSDKPLSPKEINELAQVDGITSVVTNYWLKSQSSGVYTYSVQVRKIAPSFYSTDELESRLRDLIGQISPIKIKPTITTSTKYNNLIIYISDIHAGAQNSDVNIHGIEYTEQDLHDRLRSIMTWLYENNKVYNTINIVNLGDSLDSGVNKQTTRGGHDLGSLPVRDQFDIFFRCLSSFYTSIFESGFSSDYRVINCLNDNHPGIDLAYIANKAVENYLSIKYPEVYFHQQKDFIQIYNFGNHAYAFTHGKDEKIMKYPMKKYLDDRLDSWAQQYFSTFGYHDTWNHIIKGDLHSFGVERGKFGMYVNVPSVYGTSDYISLNFGEARPGAVIEEVGDATEETRITPIWFN